MKAEAIAKLKTEKYDFYISPEDYEIAESNGISRSLLTVRIRHLAWKKQMAITTPPKKRNSLKKWAKVAKSNGIPYKALVNRIYKGWDMKRAVSTPICDKERRVEIAYQMVDGNRKYPQDILDLAARNGVKYDTFRARIRKGWDLVKAATTPTMDRYQVSRLGHQGFRKIYGSGPMDWIFLKRDVSR